jgi:hypothetical protein
MTRLTKYILTVAAAALMSSSAFAAIDFTDNFEGYPLGPDVDPIGDWKIFATVYNDYPGCSVWFGQYGVFDAPNSETAFSNITAGSSSQALNVFSDYDNGEHGNGKCIETSLFQEVNPFDAAADAGTYEFLFFTEVPGPLGTGVSTSGFIKLLDPNNNWNADIFETVSTVAGGAKSISVTLDASADGKVLQWGFSTIASNYEATGRWYDNVSFALEGVYQPPTGPSSVTYESIPIPRWALLIMAGLLVYLGGTKLRARKQT